MRGGISVNDAQSRDEMAADIDEIDRIVTQFLDFARGKGSARTGRFADCSRRRRTQGSVAQFAGDLAGGPEAIIVDTYPAAFEAQC